MPEDKNEIAKQRMNRVTAIERKNIRQQMENEQKKRSYQQKKAQIEGQQERMKIESEQRKYNEKEIQRKLKNAQAMSQALIKQMQEKFTRDRFDMQQRRQGGELFMNKYKDKVIRNKVECNGCHKEY